MPHTLRRYSLSCLQLTVTCLTLQINHARNVWDRAVTILPRANQFWYKYTYMEEMLKNIAGSRQVRLPLPLSPLLSVLTIHFLHSGTFYVVKPQPPPHHSTLSIDLLTSLTERWTTMLKTTDVWTWSAFHCYFNYQNGQK